MNLMALKKHTPSTDTEVTLFLDWEDEKRDRTGWLQGGKWKRQKGRGACGMIAVKSRF
jgi:hypothetical protein